MADEETPEPPSGFSGRKPFPVVIDGEATEIHSAGETPATSEAAEEAAPAETPPEAAAETAFAEAPPAEAPAKAEEPFAAAPPRAPDPPRPQRSSVGSFVWGFAGAVLGAAVALAAAWYYDPRAGSLQELTARQSELQAADAAQSSETKALTARLAAIEAAERGFAKTPALEAIDKRLAKLESGLVDPAAVAAAQTDARTAREDAAKALALASAAGKAGEKPAPAGSAPGPDPRIGKLEADEAALSDRIAKIETALAAPKTESRVAPSENAPKGDVAGQAIAALALEQRLNAGEPYPAEWAALSRLGADPAALAALKIYADKGAPTPGALEAAFAKIAPDLVAAGAPAPSDDAIDRLLDHMRGLVRVHAVGEVAGEDPAAVATQIEAALARGQIATALDLYGRLPEAARKEGQDWAKSAQARAAAAAAARSLREAAIGRLAAAKT